MGQNTEIGWTHILGPETGATWNPIRARTRTEPKKSGWFCIKVSQGCKFCYAETLNKQAFRGGTGLPYHQSQLENIELLLSGVSYESKGQTSIDWPLREKKSKGIFPCSMTDWLGEFVPEQWSNFMLAVMSLSQQHIFLPLTKRPKRLELLLRYFTLSGNGIQVPEGKLWDMGLMRALGNAKRWEGGTNMYQVRNAKYSVMLPWPPPNIYFGVSICTDDEAFDYHQHLVRIKQLNPGFKLWVSYEPALEVIDWYKHGYEDLIDWLVVGGESGPHARPMSMECVTQSIAFGQKYNVPVYVKQMGSVLAGELGLKERKGTDVPEIYAHHQFPDVSKAYIPWAQK